MRIPILLFIALNSWAITVFAVEHRTICIVRELDESRVPARTDGVVQTLNVRRGFPVDKGHQLAKLDTRDTLLRLAISSAELELASIKANNSGPVVAAESQFAKASEELRLLKSLGSRAIHLERYRAEKTVVQANGDLSRTQNELDQARGQEVVELREIELLQYELLQATVVSPFVGQVSEVTTNIGEWISKGDTVAVVTRMDRLQLEGFLDSDVLPPHKVTGATVSVEFEIADEPLLHLDGLIVHHTSPNLELDGKYSVWVEIDNIKRQDQRGDMQWLLRPAMNGHMSVIVK